MEQIVFFQILRVSLMSFQFSLYSLMLWDGACVRFFLLAPLLLPSASFRELFIGLFFLKPDQAEPKMEPKMRRNSVQVCVREVPDVTECRPKSWGHHRVSPPQSQSSLASLEIPWKAVLGLAHVRQGFCLQATAPILWVWFCFLC